MTSKQPQTEISRVLQEIHAGVSGAEELLYECVYAELKRLAHGHMRRERRDHTLQTTALVNEVYLRLTRGECRWQNSTHFLAAASEAMRRILVEHARRVISRRRSGQRRWAGLRGQLERKEGDGSMSADLLVALDVALARFEKAFPRHGRVVQLRYFGGRDLKEIAEVLGVSRRTVDYDWNFAKAWLQREIERLCAVEERATNTRGTDSEA